MEEWERSLPIRALPNALYSFEDREYYHVGNAVRDILSDPGRFEFRTIDPERLRPQLEGQGNIDKVYVSQISFEDTSRPVLMATLRDETVRLIDGYHRASRALQIGAPLIGVWLLTRAQTLNYMVDPDLARRLLSHT